MMKDGRLFRVIEPNCWSPEARIKDMDATGKEAYVMARIACTCMLSAVARKCFSLAPTCHY